MENLKKMLSISKLKTYFDLEWGGGEKNNSAIPPLPHWINTPLHILFLNTLLHLQFSCSMQLWIIDVLCPRAHLEISGGRGCTPLYPPSLHVCAFKQHSYFYLTLCLSVCLYYRQFIPKKILKINLWVTDWVKDKQVPRAVLFPKHK